jgi:uncharacterized protein (TIGR03437 family)
MRCRTFPDRFAAATLSLRAHIDSLFPAETTAGAAGPVTTAGSVEYASSLGGQSVPMANVISTASWKRGGAVAPISIVSALGTGFAVAEELSEYPQESLNGLAIQVVDRAGVSRPAAIYSVAPGRVDFVLPAETALGVGEVRIQRGPQTVGAGSIRVARVAPAIFTESSGGSGPPQGWAVRTEADGTETVLPLGKCTNEVCEPLELELSGPTALTLLATGARGRTSLEAVEVSMDGVRVPVVSVEAQGEFPGYDLIVTAPLPDALRNRGAVDLMVTVDGERANVVRIRVR